MNVSDMQKEILKLKKEKDVCILAHSYVAREICEIADFTGDSYGLSVQASKVPNQTVLMCGVRFMAETCKILSPEKTVILSNPLAGCPMAEQMDKEMILQVKQDMYPDYLIMAYVNTTADLKTIADVCVTSSSAVQIAKAVEADKILFIPDCNLGAFTAKQVPQKTFKLLQGGCPVHAAVKPETVQTMKKLHPEALVLVHPECVPAVTEQADYIGSTTGIMSYAKNSDAKEFIIGTEISIAEYLQYECPDKMFYPLSKELICPNMKSMTLVDVYRNLTGEAGEIIELDSETIRLARRCIDNMIRLGG